MRVVRLVTGWGAPMLCVKLPGRLADNPNQHPPIRTCQQGNGLAIEPVAFLFWLAFWPVFAWLPRSLRRHIRS